MTRFAPWLYRIAHNEAYSPFRKRRSEGETEELQPETLEGATTVGGNLSGRIDPYPVPCASSPTGARPGFGPLHLAQALEEPLPRHTSHMDDTGEVSLRQRIS